MHRRIRSSIGVVLVVSPCHSVPASQAEPIFANPAAFVGKEVRICGFFEVEFEKSNLWPARASGSRRGGLGFIPADEADWGRRLHEKRACITAEIVRTGCAEENICTWSGFSYAAREVR